jgi:hypothetical protein
MGAAFHLGQPAAGQPHRVAHAGIDLFLNGPVSDPANGNGRRLVHAVVASHRKRQYAEHLKSRLQFSIKGPIRAKVPRIR